MARISRHYSDDVLNGATIETFIAIYEDQTRGWFHDQARILEKNSDHAGFVLLLIAIAYVEGHAIFLKGQDSDHHSKKFFIAGFKDIFQFHGDPPPDTKTVEKALDEIWNEVRNGLFHTGMTRGKVILSGDFMHPFQLEWNPINGDVMRIGVNPHRVLSTVEDHLSRYVTRLRDPSRVELRKNFKKAWDLRMCERGV